MKQPLQGFAERIVRCGELDEFVKGLVDCGVTIEQLEKAVKEAKASKEKPLNPLDRFVFCDEKHP